MPRKTRRPTGKETPAQKAKVKQVMHEWKTGTLHSGSKTGPIVRKQSQAVAIALDPRKPKKRGSK